MSCNCVLVLPTTLELGDELLILRFVGDLKAHSVQVVVLSDPQLHHLLERSFPCVVCREPSEIPANAELPYMATQEHLDYWGGFDEQQLQGGFRPLTTPGSSRGSRCKIWVDLPDKWLAHSEVLNPSSRESACKAPRSGEQAERDVSSPKAKRKQHSPFQSVICRGPWHYVSGGRSHAGASSNRCTTLRWLQRMTASQPNGNCWSCISRSVTKLWKWPSLDPYPLNTTPCSKSERCMNSTAKIWGMLPSRGYGYNYPVNQAVIPSLRSFLQHHTDVVSAAVSLFPPGKALRPHKGPLQRCLEVPPAVIRGEFWRRPQFLRTDD